MSSKKLYTEYFDLDKSEAKYNISRNNTVTNNETKEQRRFPSQVAAVNWIKEQSKINLPIKEKY